MDGIKIQVTGNIAKVTEKPKRIVAGTVGLPVEFTFDSVWDDVVKTAVFLAGNRVYSVNEIDDSTTVPWEVLQEPGPRLVVGVYGESANGKEIIPTIWAEVSHIMFGAGLSGNPSDPSAAPIWQKLRNEMADVHEMVEDGYISDTNINKDGELEITYRNGNVENVGRVVGEKGEKGDTPEIVDDLYTKSTEAALSANMGAVLREKIDDDILSLHKELEADIDRVEGSIPTETKISEMITIATEQRLKDLETSVEEIIADKNYKNIDITAFSCPGAGTYEMGRSVAAPTITWSLNKTPASQSLNGEALGVDVRSKAYDGKLTSSKTYTLTVKGQKGETATKTGTFTFYNGVYWGAIADGATIDDAAILKLSKELRGDRKKTFTANAGAGQRIIYAFPSRYGTPTFNVGGFEGGFYKANAFPIMFTNGSQYAEGYDVWLSDELGNGETKVTVS
jgi:hypothetical protein